MKKISLKPPKDVAQQAAHGLKLRQKFGRGGTSVGIARARDLKNQRNLSPSTIARMVSYFARHTVDKRAPGFGEVDRPTNGYIAWLLWGGDPGKRWAEKKKRMIEAE